ncbi:YciI family protein [Wenzhouxiangella sp. AB-CW3]|uniref:YciI family protein n=1 Tax=Wenzhouxiangella sp. AB-CW3 TaxID=2771012 RepID=UPI00168A5272|nr:YciI family protein [Wenzhouxiangella sp. AB-CW3]QOC23972.1 YciI family protein [Wenzhouxiangella sp. AB-CW3]
MMYMILGRESESGLERRRASREAHLARLKALRDEGRLLLAGPLPSIDAEDPGPAGFAGSLVVAEFDSLADARDWAESDPYVQSGAWQGVEVQPFKAVLP